MQAAQPLPNARRLTLNAILIFLFTLFTFLFSLRFALAGSGVVSSIGGATFIQGAKQFWVTSSKPTIAGVTTASAQVSGTVGTQTLAATADASGNWSWTPAADLSGDNSVTITSGSTTVSFTLTIGSVPESIATASGGTLAPAGTFTPTLAILAFGVLLTTFGLWGLSRSFAKSQD